MPSLLAAAESHHRHLAALEFTSLAFLPCAPTPIADPYTVPSDKGSDKDQDESLGKYKGSDQDQDKDKGVDQHEVQGYDKGSDQESLLTRILHKGVLGAFTTLTTDTTTALAPSPASSSAASSAPALPAVARSRLPLTLNNKGDEENSPVSLLAYHSSYIPPSHRVYPHIIYTLPSYIHSRHTFKKIQNANLLTLTNAHTLKYLLV